MKDAEIINTVKTLINAYNSGELGNTAMPEDTHPFFPSLEMKRIFYTLPMALNYQRDSYKLWQAATTSFDDREVHDIFDLAVVSSLSQGDLRSKLTKHKLALQPNKHVETWKRISTTIYENWTSLTDLFEMCDSNYLTLKNIIQQQYKKSFPYLSGPKIFNYWMYIMSEYGELNLKNRSFIEIAPDTHVIQASVKLGVITESQSHTLEREEISNIWRTLLEGTGIDPIDMHSPLWFWSRGNFAFNVQ